MVTEAVPFTRRRAPHVHVVVRALRSGFLSVAARAARLLAGSNLLELGGWLGFQGFALLALIPLWGLMEECAESDVGALGAVGTSRGG